MFLIAYTSLQINVPVKWVFWTMCLGDNLLDPMLSGGLLN